MANFFTVPEVTRQPGAPEHFDRILSGKGGLLVERIISHGHVTPDGDWYDQGRDEWVIVLEGEAVLCYDDGATVALGRGDSLLLPRHVRHRVAYTSSPCIWLAVHGDGLLPGCQEAVFSREAEPGSAS